MADETEIVISNMAKILEIKEKYAKMKNFGHDADASKIRLLFKGKELQGDLFVYSYEIKDDAVLQAMIP